MTPYIPDLPAECDTVRAALAYAAAGWFVLPIDPTGKHAGSVLGKRWQDQTSRDPEQIAAWFSGTGYGLALHVGRSGAVAFDIDVPDAAPDVLAEAIKDCRPPHQSTRSTVPGRGHYLFAAAAGSVGNSLGDLPPGWGEVRGLNGIVVVQPTTHEKAAEGGRYTWLSAGALPLLPEPLAGRLRPPGAARTVLDEPTVRDWVAGLSDGAPSSQVAAVPVEMPQSGRHGEMNKRVMQLVRLGEQGHPGVPGALVALRDSFIAAVGEARAAEFRRGLVGAVAEVLGNPTPALPTVDLPDDLEALVEQWQVRRDPFDEPGPDHPQAHNTHAREEGGAREGARDPGSGDAPGAVSLADALQARLLSAEQVRALRPPPPVVEGLLTLDSESWMIARPGSYKTFVALDIAAHVARGRAWMGRAVARGDVLYLVAEGAGGMGKRVQAWEQRNGPMAGIHFLPMPVQVAREDHWDALVEVCRRLRPVLIVLDTQARITVGLNENDNSEMGQFVDAIGRLRRATGACVLVVHHLGRSGQDARGASAIDGAQDSELKLTRTADMRVVLETDKQRHLPDDVRVELELFPAELDDGGTSLVVGPPLSSAPLAPDWRANLTINQATLCEVMADIFAIEGATKAELKAEVRKRARRAGDGAPLEPMGESSFRKAWDSLVGAGRLIRVHGAQRYVLAEFNEEVP